MQSTLSRIERMTRMFSCSEVMIDGVSVKMPMPSEDETASMAGMDAENTKDVPLMRWCSVTMVEPAQNPPAAQNEFASEPTIMSTDVAGTLYNSVNPRPVRPTVPTEKDSSRISLNLYFSLSSIYKKI